ncbi:hypothetical protein ACFLYK_03950 [Candidatus Cloacimonadota bacterium]
MKNIFLVFILLILSFSLFAQYQVGDTVDDYEWTDSNDEVHSVYELTASGRAVVIFYGESW